MTIFNDLLLLQRIDQLIRTRATGSPQALAARLDVSECSVYRLIERLKNEGFPIAYDKKARTYYYTAPVKWNFECLIGPEKLISIKGGEKNKQIFGKLSIFDREREELCIAFPPHGAQ